MPQAGQCSCTATLSFPWECKGEPQPLLLVQLDVSTHFSCQHMPPGCSQHSPSVAQEPHALIRSLQASPCVRNACSCWVGGTVVEGHSSLALAQLEMGIWWIRQRWQS